MGLMEEVMCEPTALKDKKEPGCCGRSLLTLTANRREELTEPSLTFFFYPLGYEK